VPAAAPSDNHDPAESSIVDAARGGDGEAFRTLVERYQDHVFRLAMRVLRCDRNTAEDLCQEVFMRAYRGLARFDGGVRFPVWLHTIALNTVITEYRSRRTIKRGRHHALSIDAPLAGTEDLFIQPPSREPDPADRAGQVEFGAAVREAVTRLPDEFRDAVILRDMQGMSYEEVAEILGVPPGTVRSRIHRGRLILQELLKGFMS
jgi:RNA polymerase sigma-70 factor (ECF subfamily)